MAAAAQVGDIVIYRNPAARTASHPTDVTHSGIVTKVDAAGNVTEVLSKWGARGDYKHANGCTGKLPRARWWWWYNRGPHWRCTAKRPALAPEDVNVFNGHTPPPLKPRVSDLLPSTNATIFNDFPVTSLIELTDGPTNWNYGLRVPLDGLAISPGDKLDLFGTQWINAFVSGIASLATFGGG